MASRPGNLPLPSRKVRRARDGSNEQIDAFLAAWKVEPRNAITALYLGEAYRVRAWAGADGYPKLAEEALGWFQRAAVLNPYNPIPHFRSGMCLDWIGKPDEAIPYYDAALKVDPQGRVASFHVGWHHLQSGDPGKAREWFLRSIDQGYPPYGPAETYLRLIDRDRAPSAPRWSARCRPTPTGRACRLPSGRGGRDPPTGNQKISDHRKFLFAGDGVFLAELTPFDTQTRLVEGLDLVAHRFERDQGVQVP